MHCQVSHVAMMGKMTFFTILVLWFLTNSVTCQQNAKICDNSNCLAAANMISLLMNKSFNPCDDFYGYVCGGWETNYPMPSNVHDVWNVDVMTDTKTLLEIREMLEEDDSPSDSTPLKFEKWWYQACMDIDKIEGAGIRPLEEIVNFLGGWPMLVNSSDWTDEYHDWQSIHSYYLSFRGLASIFDFRVEEDPRTNNKNIINLIKPSDSLYEKLLKNQDEVRATQKYTEFIKTVVMAFESSMNIFLLEDDVNKDISDLITFEKALHQIKVSESEAMESTRFYTSIESLQNIYDQENKWKATSKIDWFATLKDLFRDFEDVIIDPSEELLVDASSYLRKISDLLGDTPNKVIVNYVHWKFISTSLPFTTEEMRELTQALTSKDDEEAGDITERWEICMKELTGVGYKYEFIQRHFSEEIQKMAEDIADETRSELLDDIEHSNWLDDDLKEEARIKLRALKWNIGVPTFYTKRENIEHFYDGLEVTTSYFDNVHLARAYLTNKYLQRLRRHRSAHKHLRVCPTLAKTIFDPSFNTLVMTVNQLNVPFIHPSLPLPINYGYMAPTVARLISRTIEKEVNTNQYVTPWSSYFGEIPKRYAAKTSCFLEQYNNHSIGPQTLDDNIYDWIGLTVAYQAYQQESTRHDSVDKLPDMDDFNADQIFFISFALKYCQSATPKYLHEHELRLYTPNDFKVILTLSNSEAFAKAFDCPLNSPMNPQVKCTL
ncbi:endothelin-converting enzyme 1 isoform X1 [Trichogramma pretiosum]|uniref:endothelin-converting enzyme 1 isoform X1 n=2 Tax=Trichogramma pretiosum TaxID=7493 RepID=UPI0006C9CC53|nr:endothelin-converting enzyme 1 isoform X1 [Trichogramma pretiosum]